MRAQALAGSSPASSAHMAFSEEIRIQVREKAAFKCCRCQSIGIEAHHIVPQKDGGPDIFENAAPLCPNCHSWFGDNPSKQKEITQMRDWWYNTIRELYTPTDLILLKDINAKVESLTINQEKSLIDLKQILLVAATGAIEQMTVGTARITASGIANASVSSYPLPSPSCPYTDEEIDAAGDQWIQQQIDIERGK